MDLSRCLYEHKTVHAPLATSNQEVEMLGEESIVSVKSVSVRDFSTRISITFLLYSSWYSKYLEGMMEFTQERFDSKVG